MIDAGLRSAVYLQFHGSRMAMTEFACWLEYRIAGLTEVAPHTSYRRALGEIQKDAVMLGYRRG